MQMLKIALALSLAAVLAIPSRASGSEPDAISGRLAALEHKVHEQARIGTCSTTPFRCFDGGDPYNCYEGCPDCYDAGCPDVGAWKTKGYSNDLSGWRQFCSSWSANRGKSVYQVAGIARCPPRKPEGLTFARG